MTTLLYRCGLKIIATLFYKCALKNINDHTCLHMWIKNDQRPHFFTLWLKIIKDHTFFINVV